MAYRRVVCHMEKNKPLSIPLLGFARLQVKAGEELCCAYTHSEGSFDTRQAKNGDMNQVLSCGMFLGRGFGSWDVVCGALECSIWSRSTEVLTSRARDCVCVCVCACDGVGATNLQKELK